MRLMTIIGSLIGMALTLIAAFGTASAPQQAAMAGLALCASVIPYVIFRVQQIGQQTALAAKHHQEVLAALERQA